MTEISSFESILLCGGRGERLTSINPEFPKSLFRVAGKELIRYSLEHMDPEFVEGLVFAVDHKSDDIENWVGNENLPQSISFSRQSEPGVLAAIEAAAEQTTGDSLIICNTDEIRDGMNLANLIDYHLDKQSLATMLVTKSSGLHRHRLVDISRDGEIINTQLKPEEYRSSPDSTGLVNTGFFLLDKAALAYVDKKYSRDWSGLIDPLCEAGKLHAFVGEDIHYFNVGTPSEYYEATEYLEQNARVS